MALKLLLVEDVEDLGRSGDVVNVRPGFARNFLLPKGFAIPADKHTLRMQARLQEERTKKAHQDKQEAEKTAAALSGIIVVSVVKVDHDGHMYGSVSALDIVHLLKEKSQIDVEKRNVLLKQPIKKTGVFSVNIKLKEGVATSFTLRITPETLPGGVAPVESENETPEVLE